MKPNSNTIRSSAMRITRQFMKARSFSLAFCFLVVVAWSVGNSSALAAEEQAPLQPIGQAKGIHPGRVVWAHDPEVTDWKGPGDGHWWEGNRVKQERVDALMTRAVCELTGEASVADAWSKLFGHLNQSRGKGDVGYKAGEKIVIKPNWVGLIYREGRVNLDTYAFVSRPDYMNTAPQMIIALLRQLTSVGVAQPDITVCDTLAVVVNEYYDLIHKAFPGVRCEDYAGKFGRIKVKSSTTPVHWSSRPQGKAQDYLPTCFAEAEYLINFANFKAHQGTGVTLCGKNHFGSLVRWPAEQNYYDIHPTSFSKQTKIYRPQVDLMGHAHLGGKTVLYLIDGLFSGLHPRDAVPQRMKLPPFNNQWPCSLFASQDPVAIDSVALDFLQAEWTDFPRQTGVDDYLREAAQANAPPSGTFYDPDHATPTKRLPSLGVHEHWNNSQAKQYSRNLGTGNGIELVDADVVAAKTAAPEPGAVSPRAGKLSIGWGSADITPPQPVALCGQFNLRISKRVNDPLTATALAIEARDDRGVVDQAVLVSVDVVCIRRVDLERVQALVKPRAPDLDPAKIILATTHTHTAPVLVDAREQNPHPHDLMATFVYRVPEQGVMQPRDYIELFATRVADAVVQAWKARQPGGVSWGLSYAVVGQNRRAHYSTGRSQMYGATDQPDFDGFESTTDPGVELLFTWDAERRLTGVAVNLACTAQEVEGADYVSADFWHDARGELRQCHGAGLHILPLCSAAGDQSPHLLFRKQAEATLRKRKGNLTARQEIGQRIATAVNAGLDLAKTDIRFEAPFIHKTQVIPLPVRKVTPQEFEAAKQGSHELEAKGLDALESPDYIQWRLNKNIAARYEIQGEQSVYQTAIHTLRLGDIALATNPFELYVDYGLRMKARSPAEQTLVIQLACDSLGYLPTERGVAGGHYSAEIMSNLIGPEGGRMLVERTVESLKGFWPSAK